MDDAAGLIDAVDSGYGLIALLIIGIFATIWKFGSEILATVRDSNEIAKESHSVTTGIEKSIITNHGSKNIGDAIDRLTSYQFDQTEKLNALSIRLEEHIDATKARQEEVLSAISE